MKDKILDTLTIIIALILILILGILILMSLLTQQEKIYDNVISCEELRECIVLELKCMEHKTINKFLIFEWDIYVNSSTRDQREFYKNSCFKLNDAKEVQDE